MSGSTNWAQVRLIARWEALRLMRDRKALFFSIVLPVLLYPLLFLGQGKLEEVSEERMASQEAELVLDLDGAEPDLATELTALLAGLEGLKVRTEGLEELGAALSLEEPERTETLREMFDELEVDLALLTTPAGVAEEGRTVFHVVQSKTDERALVARSQVLDALDELEGPRRLARLIELLGDDPAEQFRAESVDLADASDSLGLNLGRLLPLIGVLVLIGGGSFAALEAYAAEREVGTLETLLVQPVGRAEIAWGKFLVVVGAALAAWSANTLGFITCGAIGIVGDAPIVGVDGAALLGRGLLAVLCFLPVVLGVAALLSLVSARSRSFKEGQQLLLPVTLALAAAVGPAAAPGLENSTGFSLIPLFGSALAVRDVLAGQPSLLLASFAFLSSGLLAGLLLSRVGRLLDAERLLSTADLAGEARSRRITGRQATRWGWAAVAGIWIVGSWLQSRSLVVGLLLTLWGLALPLGLAAAFHLARTSGRRPAELLALRAPRVSGGLWALGLAPCLVFLIPALMELQQRLLPMPSMDAGAFGELFSALLDRPRWQSLFLIALSPAVCEELVFRGAVLGGLARDTRPARAIAIQALLFALAHGSVHRLMPTFLLGGVLGLLRLRTGSIWPCVLLHALYNGALVQFSSVAGGAWDPLRWGLSGLAALALGITLASLAREHRAPRAED